MSKEAEISTGHKVIEGKALITFPNSNEVFYNPVQVFNRDVSVACIHVFKEDLFPQTVKYEKKKKQKTNNNDNKNTDVSQTEQSSNETPGFVVFEGLAASGLRSIRYALEIPGIEKVIATDISIDAVKLMQKNIEENNVSGLVESLQMDASLVMYQHRYPVMSRFDVIDLDPYGSPAEFLDGAVQCIIDGGLLAVTCTDMAVLCGNHSEACYAKYGSMSLKGKFCHEMALRIILSSIESHANHYKRYIVPLLSISADFYVRVFVQVFTSASEVKRSASKKSLVYHCIGCGSFFFQPVGKRIEVGNSKKYPPGVGPPVGETCEHCGRKFHVGGPIWSEPIHDLQFVNKVLEKVKMNRESYKTSERIIGMLTLITEELPHSPLYYTLDHLSSIVHCTTPSMIKLRSAILRCGYKVSGSHAAKLAIKTNAPSNVIWDIMRTWVKNHPSKKNHERSPGFDILKIAPKTEVSFEFHFEANPVSKQLKMVRFPENPEPEWGPKARAKRKADSDDLAKKRLRNQGKRKKRESDADRR